jgi:hypothetical protein
MRCCKAVVVLELMDHLSDKYNPVVDQPENNTYITCISAPLKRACFRQCLLVHSMTASDFHTSAGRPEFCGECRL